MKFKIFDKSILLFMAVGVANTLLSAFIMFLLEDLGYWMSTVIAYFAGSILSFFLNRYITFKSDEKLLRSAVKFAVNVAVCYVVAYSLAQPLVNWAMSFTTVEGIWQERIAKIFGMVLFTILNYIGQRFFAFATKK